MLHPKVLAMKIRYDLTDDQTFCLSVISACTEILLKRKVLDREPGFTIVPDGTLKLHITKDVLALEIPRSFLNNSSISKIGISVCEAVSNYLGKPSEDIQYIGLLFEEYVKIASAIGRMHTNLMLKTKPPYDESEMLKNIMSGVNEEDELIPFPTKH